MHIIDFLLFDLACLVELHVPVKSVQLIKHKLGFPSSRSLPPYSFNNSLFQQEVMIEEACQALCLGTPGCQFYTWFNEDNRIFSMYCFLFNSCDKVYSIQSCILFF